MKKSEVFIDVGHGIGNAVLQAAFTIGCESRGIEVVPDRCQIADQFCELMFEKFETSSCRLDQDEVSRSKKHYDQFQVLQFLT